MSNAKGNDPSFWPQNWEKLVFRRSLISVGLFVGLIWLIKLVEIGLDYSISNLGILPRTVEGIKGILFAPLLHVDMVHLLSNSFPLILLGVGLFYFYTRIAWEVFAWIYLTTGFWVWVAARGDSFHVGASGVVYGLAAFLIVGGFIRKKLQIITISLAVLFLYGGMFYGVLPGDPSISWESHLLGGLSGALLAIYFRREPIWTLPKAPAPEESEDVEEEEAEEPSTFPSPVSTRPATFTYTFGPNSQEEHNQG